MAWLLIDGNNWFAQCDFANSAASQQNFLRRLETVANQVSNTRCVVCWDEGESFRVAMAPSYKAHRDSKPLDFHIRLKEVREQVDRLSSFESFAACGFEADDCIATMVSAAHAEGEQAILFSADKDLHQLLSPGTVTQVIKVERQSLERMNFVTVSADGLRQRYGVLPFQWIDYRAIVGDASDGIKGCPGLGEKAARELLNWSKTLDEFYLNPWAAPVSNKQMQALISYRDELPLKRQLLRLASDIPLPQALFATSK